MKNNLNEIIDKMLPELESSNGFSIDEVLNDIMPQIKFEEHPTKARMAREIIRGRLTTILNSNGIYSYEKGRFVSIENADEGQLLHFLKKAKRDIDAADARRANAEERLHQISMAWDEEGHFIGFVIPEAMTI